MPFDGPAGPSSLPAGLSNGFLPDEDTMSTDETLCLTSDEDEPSENGNPQSPESPLGVQQVEQRRFFCPRGEEDGSCLRTFTRKSDADRHARSVHGTRDQTNMCSTCHSVFSRSDAIKHHLKNQRCFQKRGRKKGARQGAKRMVTRKGSRVKNGPRVGQ
ncbi:hypothetical protein CALVIDRAFT_163095 [Calocera viscosa TUFC12733]|uniref:C2H2-type domain-containing protein n=1 Tax=Calocera viscosa (strain TUFC12733) TaxID=1330018 RepID=A0A167LE00_CALVF|nr:hypothetical protein CALVIDRAFT_163095 [Calocera viscosa TUFC12733]